MLTRTTLWGRLAGASLWPLAWALAAACAVPWLLPESWDGRIETRWLGLGCAAWVLSLPLVRWRPGRAVPLALGLAGLTALGLGSRARWETALPVGFQALEGTLSSPWNLQGTRLRGTLEVSAPPALAGTSLPLSVPAEGDQPPPPPGTPVRLRAELRAVPPAPRFLAERPLWRARSDEAPRQIHLASSQLLEPTGPPAPGPLLAFQAFIRRRFDALDLGPTARDLWGALALGIPPVDEAHFSVFAESGTIHTLVVSGLQVTLVMVALEGLLRRLRVRGLPIAVVAGGLLYAALVGFNAPVWRGLFMGVAWVVGRHTGWALPPVAGLHLALLLWLPGHPAAGVEPGFLLAWWALLGLLWGSEPLAGIVAPLLGRWALPLARVTAPWLATLPLLALLHGGAPLWGIPANLLVLPLVAFMTPLCLVLLLVPLPGVTPAAAAVLTWTGDRLVPAFTGLAPLATGILWPWLLLALGWLVLAHRQGRHRRTRALAVGLTVATGLLLATRGTGRAPDTLSVEALDIGQGDAILLREPGGEATLVDTGPSPWSARRVVRTLSRRGVREPIHLVLTHPHADHAGGWATLTRLWPLASTSVPVTAGEGDPWEPYRPLAGRPEAGLLRDDAWTRGGSAFSVRWPPVPLALPDANAVSLVLRLQWQDREAWLMGDALAVQEGDLMDLGDPGASPRHRLLKSGHHGGRGTASPPWLGVLAPDLALVSAGRRNRFDHPHPATLEDLRAAAVPAWTTGHHAGVRVAAVPGGWLVETGDGQLAFSPFRTTPRPAGPPPDGGSPRRGRPATGPGPPAPRH